MKEKIARQLANQQTRGSNTSHIVQTPTYTVTPLSALFSLPVFLFSHAPDEAKLTVGIVIYPSPDK